MQNVSIKKASRGFTLIELLVVIAIIGILAAIVLASLGTARSKGNDAKVKEQLNSIRNAAEVYYSSANSYGSSASGINNTSITTGACAGASTMLTDTASGMVPLVTIANYPAGTSLSCNINAAGSAYAVSASLSSGFWCVDSTGKSISESANLASGVTACP